MEDVRDYVLSLLSDTVPKWLLNIILKDDYIKMFSQVFDFNKCVLFQTVGTALTEDLITWYMQENNFIPKSSRSLPVWPESIQNDMRSSIINKKFVFARVEDKVTKMRQYFEHFLKTDIIKEYKMNSFFSEKNKNKKYTQYRYVIILNDENDLTKGSKTELKEVEMKYDFEAKEHYIFDNFFECFNRVLQTIFLNSNIGYIYVKMLFNKFLKGRKIKSFISKRSFLGLIFNLENIDGQQYVDKIYDRIPEKKRAIYEGFFKSNNIYMY